MAVPFTFDDTMRCHDRAVYNWVGQIPIDYGDVAGTTRNAWPILRTYASPDNAFATIVDVLVASGWIAGSTAAQMRANADQNWPVLPLPIATIERGQPVMDIEQQGNAKFFRQIDIDPETGGWRFHQWPNHMATTYRVTFWSKKRYTEAWIREWVYAQMGPLGCAQNEMLLPVVHPSPWGTQGQRWRFESSTDQSHLEGDGQRYLRYEFEFSLRTLVFKPPTVGARTFQGIGIEPAILAGTPPGEFGAPPQDELVPQEDVSAQMSDNMFLWAIPTYDIPTKWPVTGAATVSALSSDGGVRGTQPEALVADVHLAADTVELTERFNSLDTDTRPKVIMSTSFLYQSTADADLEVDSHDLTSGTMVQRYLRRLPASPTVWLPVHQFFLSNDQASVVRIAGAGSAAEVTLRDIDVRMQYDATRLAYQALHTNVGGFDIYQWANLGPHRYLVVGVLDPTDTVVGTVTCNDDPVSPTWPQTQDVTVGASSTPTCLGFVFLVQPLAGAISVAVPTGMVLDAVYVQRYHGPYDGNAV